MTLLERAVKVHGITTDKGAVADTLPLSACYGLLAGLEYGQIDGIRSEDQRAFLAHFGGDTKAVMQAMDAGNDVLMDNELMSAGQVSAGYKDGTVARYGYMELTDKGKRYAKRLKVLSQDATLIDCDGCNTVHRTDVPCPW